MSDTSQGPGWWIASDGKWYPPEQAADYVAPPPPPEPDLPPPPTQETPVVPPSTSPSVPAAAPAATLAGTAPPSAPPPGPPLAPAPGPPPPLPPGSATAPPAAATKSGNGCLKAFIIVAIVLVLLGAGTVAVFAFFVDRAVNSVSSDIDAQAKVERETGIKSNPLGFNSKNPPQKDISADDMDCRTDGSGDMEAAGTLTNHSSKTSLYTVTISFRRNGAEVATASDFLPSVDPGQTAKWVATSSTPADGSFVCRIVEIDRLDVGTFTPPTN